MCWPSTINIENVHERAHINIKHEYIYQTKARETNRGIYFSVGAFVWEFFNIFKNANYFHTHGGYVTGTKPLAFGGGLFIAAKRAWTSQYNLLFKL